MPCRPFSSRNRLSPIRSGPTPSLKRRSRGPNECWPPAKGKTSGFERCSAHKFALFPEKCSRRHVLADTPRLECALLLQMVSGLLRKKCSAFRVSVSFALLPKAQQQVGLGRHAANQSSVNRFLIPDADRGLLQGDESKELSVLEFWFLLKRRRRHVSGPNRSERSSCAR
jgi:hypothetical protein